MIQSARWLIPAYVYPTLDPDGWRALARLGSRAVAVINPNNGPGSWIDANYQSAVALLREAGVTLVGYSDTAYGARSIDDVLTDQRLFVEYYGIDGLFLDQMPFRVDGYVSDLADTLARVDSELTVANAGCPVVDEYLAIFDAVVTFENTHQRFRESRDDSAVFRTDLDPSLRGRVAHLVYDVPASDIETMVSLLAAGAVGYIGIACNDAAAAWCSLTAVSHLT